MTQRSTPKTALFHIPDADDAEDIFQHGSFGGDTQEIIQTNICFFSSVRKALEFSDGEVVDKDNNVKIFLCDVHLTASRKQQLADYGSVNIQEISDVELSGCLSINFCVLRNALCPAQSQKGTNPKCLAAEEKHNEHDELADHDIDYDYDDVPYPPHSRHVKVRDLGIRMRAKEHIYIPRNFIKVTIPSLVQESGIQNYYNYLDYSSLIRPCKIVTVHHGNDTKVDEVIAIIIKRDRNCIA